MIEPHTCERCGVIYDEARGDGWCGLCPSCADLTEPEERKLTFFSPDFKARYGFGGWDDPRPTENCLHCKGTGMADEHNECGFCFADGEGE